LYSSDISVDSLTHNVKLIAEGLARHMYGLSCEVYIVYKSPENAIL